MMFALHMGPSGSVRFSDERVALIRFRPGWQWEFYVIVQRGRLRGLEEFVRYLDAGEAARVESALECELARRGDADRLAALHRAGICAAICVATGRTLT